MKERGHFFSIHFLLFSDFQKSFHSFASQKRTFGTLIHQFLQLHKFFSIVFELFNLWFVSIFFNSSLQHEFNFQYYQCATCTQKLGLDCVRDGEAELCSKKGRKSIKLHPVFWSMIKLFGNALRLPLVFPQNQV